MTQVQNQDATSDAGVVVGSIHPNTDPNVAFKETQYHFKTDKELGVKRPTVKLALPVPTVAGIVNILETGGKDLELLLEVVADVIISEAREQVNANTGISQETLDLTKLSWNHIANLPKAERRGSSISAETWTSFISDYTEIMPAITGKKPEAVSNAAKLFAAKLNPAKGSKDIIALLKPQLALWYSNTKQTEELAPVYEYLMNKMEVMLKADDPATLLANL